MPKSFEKTSEETPRVEHPEKIAAKKLPEAKFSVYKNKIEETLTAARKERDVDVRRNKLESVLRYARLGLEKTDERDQVRFLVENMSAAQDDLVKQAYDDGKKATALLRSELEGKRPDLIKPLDATETSIDTQYRAVFPEQPEKKSLFRIAIDKILSIKKRP